MLVSTYSKQDVTCNRKFASSSTLVHNLWWTWLTLLYRMAGGGAGGGGVCSLSYTNLSFVVTLLCLLMVCCDMIVSVYQHVQKCLNPESANYITSIVALGHLAYLCPDAFATDMKNLVTKVVVKDLLMVDRVSTVSQGHTHSHIGLSGRFHVFSVIFGPIRSLFSPISSFSFWTFCFCVHFLRA